MDESSSMRSSIGTKVDLLEPAALASGGLSVKSLSDRVNFESDPVKSIF